MAIAFVNNVGTNVSTAAGTSTITLVPAQNCGAGNLLVVMAATGGTRTLSSVTDTKGNTWTVDTSLSSPAGGGVATTLQNAGALTTGDTITATFSATGANKTIAAMEFSGIASGTRLDQTATAATGTTATSMVSGTTSATTQANELVIGAFCWIGASQLTSAKGASYTALLEADENAGADLGCSLEYKIVSATGTQSADATLSGAGTNWTAFIATYFAAASASSGPSQAPLALGLASGLVTIPGSNPLAILQPAPPAWYANTLVATDPATATVTGPAPSVGDPALASAVFPLTGLLGPLLTIPGTAVLLNPAAPGDFPVSQFLVVPPATATAGQPAVNIDARVLTDPASATAAGVAPQVGDPTLASAVFPLGLALLGPLNTIPGTMVVLQPALPSDPLSGPVIVSVPPATATAGQVTPGVNITVPPTPGAATAGQPTVSVTASVAATFEPAGLPLTAISGAGMFIPGSRVRLRDHTALIAAPAGGTGPQLISVPPAAATVSAQNLGWFKALLDVQAPSGTSSPSTLTVSANVPAGDTIVVAAEYSTVVRTVSSVTDTQGNTYTVDANVAGANTAVALCSSRITNPLSPGDVITITMSGATTAGRIHAALWYGGLLSSYVDSSAFGTATDQLSSPATVSGAGATAQANEVVIGLAGLDFNASAASVSGYVQRVNQTSSGTVRTLVVADSRETAAGTKAFTASWTGTLVGSAFILGTYKASSGVGSVAIPQVRVAPVPRTTTVTTPAAQVFWPQAIVLSVPPATAIVHSPSSIINNLGVSDTVNEVIRPTQYHQVPLQTYSHGVAVVAGHFTFSSAYQTGGDVINLPPAFQSAHVINFNPVGGYVFEYTGSTVKAYLNSVEVPFGTPLNTLGPIPYLAYVLKGL